MAVGMGVCVKPSGMSVNMMCHGLIKICPVIIFSCSRSMVDLTIDDASKDAVSPAA